MWRELVSRHVLVLLPLVAVVTLGCGRDPVQTPPTPGKSAAKIEAAKPAPPAPIKKVVFDPRNPPPGYVNCHRNHCHKVGGGVASYAQVMEAMGATEMVGGLKPKPMPPAPSDVSDPPEDAQWTDSGLATRMLKAGSGEKKPGADSVVSAHYTGWTRGGKGFDSSVARGRPATFPLKRMPAGFSEGIQLMTVGEERRMWIPQNLAFEGKPGRPPGMVVFDVELREIR